MDMRFRQSARQITLYMTRLCGNRLCWTRLYMARLYVAQRWLLRSTRDENLRKPMFCRLACRRVLTASFLVAILVMGSLLIIQTISTIPIVAQDNATDTESDSTIHVVQRGDTVFAIARRYGVSIADLLAHNGLVNADFIYVGQRLTIPEETVALTATVESETVVDDSATKVPTATATIAATLSPVPTPNPTPTVTPQAVPTQILTTIYTVQPGDMLSVIAQRFETTVADLLRRNGMANANYVYVGQKLEVPVPANDDREQNSSGSESNPIRLNFASGATAISVEGLLTFPERVCYVLEAAAGQEMQVTVASGGDIANFFVRSADGAVNGGLPLKRLENEERAWTYTLPISGDYIICVATPEGAVAYLLTVSIPVACTSVTQEIEVVDWESVIANDPSLRHETIGDDDYVSVSGSSVTVSGIPQFTQIVYGDFDGDCMEEAGIPLFSGGTAGNVGFLVYDIAEADDATGMTPTLVAWGDGYKLLLLADSGLLIVSNTLYNGWEPNCCPSGVSYDGYRLREGQLIQVSSDSEGFAEMRVETVNHFYQLLQDGNFADAYAMFSPDFQDANPFTAWVEGYANTQSVEATVSTDGDMANRALVELEVNERLSNGATRIRHYSGYWDLIWNGTSPGWMLHDGNFVVVP